MEVVLPLQKNTEEMNITVVNFRTRRNRRCYSLIVLLKIKSTEPFSQVQCYYESKTLKQI